MSTIVRSNEMSRLRVHHSITSLAVLLALGCACSRSFAPDPIHAMEVPSAPTTSGAEHSHQFPDPEEYADTLDDPSRDAWQKPEEVVALLECQSGMRAVDLGAGTGYFLRDLSRCVGADGRVIALDVSPEMVELIEERIEREMLPNVDAATIAPDDPGLSARSVDRILVVNTWHHIEGRVAYARKLRQALRPNGAVLIVDFTKESPIGPPETMRLTIDTIAAELEEAGLLPEVVEETLPHQYVVRGRAP